MKRRLSEIVEYLLTVQLNVNVDGQTGKESNRRLRSLFLEYVEAIQPAVFFDIGAHDGGARRPSSGCFPSVAPSRSRQTRESTTNSLNDIRTGIWSTFATWRFRTRRE